MLYSNQITIPANTQGSAPTSTKIKLSLGFIHTIWLTFPPGCVGLVKIRMLIDGHPFLPVHQDSYISGDGYTFPFPVMFEITDEPMTLTVEAWNDDDTYNHSIQVIILVLPKELILPSGSTEGILESLKTLVLRPIVIQQAATEET